MNRVAYIVLAGLTLGQSLLFLLAYAVVPDADSSDIQTVDCMQWLDEPRAVESVRLQNCQIDLTRAIEWFDAYGEPNYVTTPVSAPGVSEEVFEAPSMLVWRTNQDSLLAFAHHYMDIREPKRATRFIERNRDQFYATLDITRRISPIHVERSEITRQMGDNLDPNFLIIEEQRPALHKAFLLGFAPVGFVFFLVISLVHIRWRRFARSGPTTF